jgi:hypothetical protein
MVYCREFYTRHHNDISIISVRVNGNSFYIPDNFVHMLDALQYNCFSSYFPAVSEDNHFVISSFYQRCCFTFVVLAGDFSISYPDRSDLFVDVGDHKVSRFRYKFFQTDGRMGYTMGRGNITSLERLIHKNTRDVANILQIVGISNSLNYSYSRVNVNNSRFDFLCDRDCFYVGLYIGKLLDWNSLESFLSRKGLRYLKRSLRRQKLVDISRFHPHNAWEALAFIEFICLCDQDARVRRVSLAHYMIRHMWEDLPFHLSGMCHVRRHLISMV